MMNINKIQIKNHMTLEYEWSGIRIVDDVLVPVDWKLNIDFVATSNKKSKAEVENISRSAYQRMYFWLDINLPNIIIVDTTNEVGMNIANAADNIMMYCPSDCSDEVLIQCIHSKLSVLADKDLIIGEITLKSTDTPIKYTFNYIDEYDLPKLVSEYIEGITMHDIPWWLRKDGFCFEFGKPEDFNEISKEEFFKDIVDPLAEFEKMMNENLEENTQQEKAPAEIIQVEKWKPKKV